VNVVQTELVNRPVFLVLVVSHVIIYSQKRTAVFQCLL